jgi:AAA domain (Cdc48 subfamily)
MATGTTFSSLPLPQSNGEDLSDDYRSLTSELSQIGLEPEQISAVRGYTRLKPVIDPKNGVDINNACKFLGSMGFLHESKAVLAAARRSAHLNGTADEILKDIITNKSKAELLISGDYEKIRNAYPTLSKSQAILICSVLKHQAVLDKLDVEKLCRSFPFPILQQNFFGRFIAGGSDSPLIAIRHLEASTQFFIHAKSIIEGLCSPKNKFIVIDSSSVTTKDDKEITHKHPLDVNLTNILHASVNAAHDFHANTLPLGVKSLRVIILPHTHKLDLDAVEPHEKTKLTVEYMDWLLFNKKDGVLLTRKEPFPAAKRELRNIEQDLQKKKALLKALEKKAQSKELSPFKQRRLGDRMLNLEKEISSSETKRKNLKSSFKAIKPIINDLEKYDGAFSPVRNFRQEVQDALKAGHKIVFSSLTQHAPSNALKLIDRAFNAKNHLASPAVKCLRNASYLLDSRASELIQDHRIPGLGSIVELQMRCLSIPSEVVNTSTNLIISNTLPEHDKLYLTDLASDLVEICEPVGADEDRELIVLTRIWKNKKNITANDLLEYAFEHATMLHSIDLQNLLDILGSYGIDKLPERCREIAITRFQIPEEVFSRFEIYSHAFAPDTVGDLPDLFEERTTLSNYLTLRFDALGMRAEIQEVDKHLVESGIVGILDSTSYHPELQVKEKAPSTKDGEEHTEEVWGNYVHLSERLIRSLAVSIMEGRVSKTLQNSTLTTVVEPPAEEKLKKIIYQKFLGIELAIGPDLANVNSVIAELATYDPRTILVLDAKKVTNLEQYREFVDTLRKSHIKVIITNLSSPLPGIPHVHIQPLIDVDLPKKLLNESNTLARMARLSEAPSEEVLNFTFRQTQLLRGATDDPLNLGLQVIACAAQHARILGHNNISRHDVVQVLPAIFHRPDAGQLQLKTTSLNRFVEICQSSVLGQKTAIIKAANLIENHILGLRDPIRPLTFVLVGPSGVGKTELAQGFAKSLDLPFFFIEGSQYSESHTISRLIGSPTGYVGPDKGPLYLFAEKHSSGLVFVDEIEKMHPDVYMGLMNFWDLGILTAGNGETVKRPGFIISAASNAGASQLTRETSEIELRKILANSFKDRDGASRPELVARFEPIKMLAIDKKDFRAVLQSGLKAMTERPGIVNANIEIVNFDKTSEEILYEASRDLCEFNEKQTRLGFRGGIMPATNSMDLFYNLRHVSRAIDARAGDSLRTLVQAQYASGHAQKRTEPKKIRLVGDKESGLILAHEAA